MRSLDVILNYLFFMGVSFLGGLALGVIQRPYALEKILDFCTK